MNKKDYVAIYMDVGKETAIKNGKLEYGILSLNIYEKDLEIFDIKERLILIEIIESCATKESALVVPPNINQKCQPSEATIKSLHMIIKELVVRKESQTKIKFKKWMKNPIRRNPIAKNKWIVQDLSDEVLVYLSEENKKIYVKVYEDAKIKIEDRIKAQIEIKKLKNETRKQKYEKQKKSLEVYNKEKNKWIEEHGSNHIKELVAENIECDKTYRKERLNLERYGWIWKKEVSGKLGSIKDPSVENMKALKKARSNGIDCKLKNHDVYGPVLISNLLNEEIIATYTTYEDLE